MKEALAVALESVEFQSEGSLIRGSLYQANPPQTAANSTQAIILCHGAFEHQSNWSAYAQRLAENGFTVLTFDFAGHGSSAGLPGAVGMKTWAYNLRDAMNYLARRGCQRFGLVGWNSGGSAALLAAAHDERVKCLVCLAAGVRIMPDLSDRIFYGGASLVSRLFQRIRKRPLTLSRLRELAGLEMAVDQAVNAQYFEDPLIRKAYAHVPIAESLDSVWLDITRSIERIQAPALILHGAQDQMLPPKQSKLLFDRLPGLKKMRLVENAGHALHLDQARDEVFLQIVVWMKKYLSS